MCNALRCSAIGQLFSRVDPIEVKNLFFKGSLAKIGSSSYIKSASNYTFAQKKLNQI